MKITNCEEIERGLSEEEGRREISTNNPRVVKIAERRDMYAKNVTLGVIYLVLQFEQMGYLNQRS